MKMQMSITFLKGVESLLEALKGHNLDEDTQMLCKTLKSELDAKFEAMEKRNAFTAYKTAQVKSDDRELKRHDYLDKATIHKDWRSEKETTF